MELTAGHVWLMVAAALVLFMTPGLAFFYGGMTRAKAALNMMMMSFISIGIVGVVWVLWGSSMSSGEGFMEIVGNPFATFGLEGISTPDGLIKVGYAATFAIITVALISGAIADRAKFGAWSLFVPVWVTLVYAPLAYMVWGGGLFGPEGAIGKALGPAIGPHEEVGGFSSSVWSRATRPRLLTLTPILKPTAFEVELELRGRVARGHTSSHRINAASCLVLAQS